MRALNELESQVNTYTESEILGEKIEKMPELKGMKPDLF